MLPSIGISDLLATQGDILLGPDVFIAVGPAFSRLI